jgi:hypothetical protein
MIIMQSNVTPPLKTWLTPKNGGELGFQLIKSNIKNSMKNSVILKQ